MDNDGTHKVGGWTRDAVGRLCRTVKSGGRLDQSSIRRRLETYMEDSYGFPVSISRIIVARRRLPQLILKHCSSAREVHINCFTWENRGEEDDFEDTLRQFSIAAVLAVSSPDFVDELSPDETYETFAQNHSDYAQLSQKVYDALKNVT